MRTHLYDAAMAFFDPTRPSYRADPYPALARLRAEDPVHWSPAFKAWVPTRYAECAEVLRDGRRFTADPARTEGPRAAAVIAHRAAAPMGDVPTLGTSSGEGHRALRRIVNPVFSPAAVRAAQPSVARLVEGLLAGVPSGAPFDFMEAVANPLPKRVMVSLMGFPEEEAAGLQQMLSTIEVARSNPQAGPALMAEARAAETLAAESLGPVLADGVPPGTVLGALRHAPDMSIEQLTSVAAHIATVGADPTTGALANSVAALAAHPEAADGLRCSPGRLRMAVHELLRFDSPTHIVPRFAATDTELAGRRIRRGDAVLAIVGAANRDPAEFPAPELLDIERDARRQLGFGQGEHICLGAPLALVMLETALGAMLRRFERIELAAGPEYGPAVELRIPERMMLRCS